MRIKLLRIFESAILFLILSLPVFGQELPKKTEFNTIDPGLAKEMENFSIEQMQSLKSPGLGVGIVMGNTLVYEGYYGWANIEEKKPVAPNTFFRIGSISKSVTAIGILQQWETDKFQIGEDVNNYLPEKMIFPPHPDKKPVTFQTLLTHTSGGGEFLSYRQLLMKNFGVMVDGEDYLPLEDYLKIGMKTKVDPGLKYAYSNYGYSFLGLALETMAGEPFDVYMKKNVFAPLGMKETTYQHTADMLPRIITGYTLKNGKYQPRVHRAFGITPAGNIYTTIDEFSLYVEALLNNGANKNGRVIKADTLKEMMSDKHSFDYFQEAYGYGLRVYGENIWGQRIVGHSGSVPFGYTSHMLLAPGKKIGVYVFANSDTRVPTPVAWGILRMMLGAKDQPPPTVAPDKKVWPELVGYYGPEYRDFKTSARIYIDGIGAYRIAVINDELCLIYTWQGKKKAKKLHQLSSDDPYFFWYEDKRESSMPQYLSFQKGDEGQLYLVPGGYEEFMKLDKDRVARVKAMIPLGRVLAKTVKLN